MKKIQKENKMVNEIDLSFQGQILSGYFYK